MHDLLQQDQKSWISKINTWIGQAVSWLILVLILELAYDTAARYLCNAPTQWSYDISYMLYGLIFMLGAAHTLKNNAHVRIDLFLEKCPPKVQAWTELCSYCLFFFPSMLLLIYFGGKFTYHSWQIKEQAGTSMWSPPIYPFKAVIPVSAFLLLLQGIVQVKVIINRLRTNRHVQNRTPFDRS